MLSYRHAFHAGNHADVLKHLVLVQLLQHMRQKDKPFWVIDTHAGAGLYALKEGYATKLAEYADGIARLWDRTDTPAAIGEYVDAVRAINGDALSAYPGSPWIAQQSLREQDRLRLFELHSSDSRMLADNMRHAAQQTIITQGDGFAGLKALLPPASRRAITLIDPSYELAEDYTRVIDALSDSLRRFATGVYAVWYPMLAKPESRRLPARLQGLGAASWLHVGLTVRGLDTMGMYGSGMFVINPPWKLMETLREVMPWLTGVLAQDDAASFVLEGETP
ncbi:MAG: 23S rRNA (adenine(2030)-N(6))-methyltransferase RlmJ [Rhodocyclaceae bacterium]